jgi:hypothetical protein
MSYMVEATVALMRVSLAAAFRGHAAPAADADDANLVRINVRAGGQVIYRRGEIFGVNIGGGYVPGLAAALSGKGGVKGDGQKAPLRHLLGVEPGRLFLDGAEGAADCQGGQFAGRMQRGVQVGGQGDAVPVMESDFLVLNLAALREDLVPFLGKL